MKQIVKPAAVLLTVCVVVALLLAGTQVLTKDRIAALEAEQKAEAILSVLPVVSAMISSNLCMLSELMSFIDSEVFFDGAKLQIILHFINQFHNFVRNLEQRK